MTDSIQTEEVLLSFVGFGVLLACSEAVFSLLCFFCKQEEKTY